MSSENKLPVVALVDGSNYVYRAFYGIPQLTNSKGFPTNAIYGFTTMLLKLLRDLQPDYIVVTFDLKGATLRHEEFADYKATRKPMPDDLIPQIPFIKEVVRGLSVTVLEKQGVEADDIIGTLAGSASRLGWKTILVSGDKDLMQLIDENVTMIDTMRDKTYDVAAVKERFGVGPDKVTEILGLMGDTSDNIPGVPGIGPKTAQRLIEEYGSVEEVIRNTENLRNVKLRESFRRHAEQARMSRQLALIRRDIEIDFDLKDAVRREPDKEVLSQLFSEFEFSSLLQEIKRGAEKVVRDSKIIQDRRELEHLVTQLQNLPEISLEIIREKTQPADLIGLALSTGNDDFYIPLGHTSRQAQLPAKDVLAALAPVLNSGKIKKHVHDLKAALLDVANSGVEIQAGNDIMLAAYLVNPSRNSYDLGEIAWEYLHEQIPSVSDVAGGKGKTYPLNLVPIDKMAAYAGVRAATVFALAPVLSGKLKEIAAADLFDKVEMPLLHVLSAMEKKGVLVNVNLLGQMSRELAQLLSMSEEKIFRLAGEKFNINSPKQLQSILFDKLKLPTGKKTKEGFSTDVDVLSSLAQSHELPAEILAYRSLAKLKSTYVDALPVLVDPQTGRIHTSYN
ncbi:MAG: DNA polymerase I, partial [Deltaproteobacteria bacterium HGW-Deltaproteobacteria-9]